jgi:hypothetical protein
MINPSLFEFQPMHVAVELSGANPGHDGMRTSATKVGRLITFRSRGMRRGQAPNADVARASIGRFFDPLVSTLATYR